MIVLNISQILNGVLPSVPAFSYGIPTLRVQKSSMVTLCMDSLLVRLTISSVASSIVMLFNNQKWIERFYSFVPHKFNVVISEDTYELLLISGEVT